MAASGTFQEMESFLKNIPPFNLLPEKALRQLIPSLTTRKFLPAEVILTPSGPPTQFLYVVQSGSVNFTIADGVSGLGKIVDSRGEKELFGVFSLWSNRPSPFTIVAEKNTCCYLITRAVFNQLLEDYSDFLLHFTMGPSKGFRSTSSTNLIERRSDPSRLETDSQFFTARVRDLMKFQVITCRETDSAIAAARLMTQRGVGSIIVVDSTDKPLGIVTDGDLRKKIIAEALDPHIPVSAIMTSPLLSVTPDTFYFEALLTMIRHRVKYLTVMNNDKMAGILSERDLVISQGNNPVSIIRQIYQAPDLDALVQIHRDIIQTLKVLLSRGGQAKEISQLITQLNDHLTVRIIQLTEDNLERQGQGRPPVPYVWMALGSEGRQEQTLCTDQDNALIFADTDPAREPEIQAYFLALAQQVVSGLERCGFPLCSGGIMASNRQWCQPLQAWKDHYRKWILDGSLSSQELLISSIFFDFRALYGAEEHVTELRSAIHQYLSKNQGFLRQLAIRSLELQTPLSFFNRLVVQKSGTHKNKLNIKLYGLMPLVDAIRILALEQALPRTNTLERIEALIEKGIFPPGEGADLQEAFNLLMLLQLRNHLNQLNHGQELNNYINPAELSLIQNSVLKTAFKSIEQIQARIEIRYGISALGTR